MHPLADVLEEQFDALLKQWVARVGASLAPGRSTTPELVDHLPTFLRQVIAAMREPAGRADTSPVDGQSPAGREHGAQRFRQGFELEAVVREYGLLLHLVLDLVEGEGATASIREVRRLNDLVTSAVAEATAEYARRLAATAQASLGLLETTLFSMGDGVLATDAAGRITLMNPAAEGLTGWSAGEALGQPVEAVLSLVHATTRAALPDPFAAVLRGEPAPRLGDQVLLVQRDGVTLAFADSLAAIRDGEGVVVGAVLVFRDETEARHKDAELRTFRAVVEASTDFISIGRPGGRPDYVNPAGLRLVGLDSVEAASALEVAEYYTPETREATIAELLPVVRAGRSFHGETVLRHFVTGEAIPVSQAAFAVNDANGRPIVLAAVIRDRREQHRSIEALQRSEESFRTLAEAIPQQVWTSTPEGALDFVNQRVLDYFAEPKERVLGAGWQVVLHPDDLVGSMDRWTHSLATGEEYEVEFRLRRSDGTYRWHLARAVASRDARGQIIKWFGTNTDIDEAKRVREELEKRTEFEQHLLGIVSHDLRNPLGAILLGATGLLEMEEQSEWVTKIARRIHSSADRSARMISDLLDFTQARLGGGIRLERRATDLYSLVSATLDEVEVAYPDRTLDLTRAGDTRGTWDADRIVQVVTNLVTNALKYSPPGTPVAVRAAGQDDSVELTVHNVCPPIPQERLGRIFEPLQRASDQIDRKTRSVGLGLYIVDAIVRAHGGTVGVVSTAEAGTTFTVRLPRVPLS